MGGKGGVKHGSNKQQTAPLTGERRGRSEPAILTTARQLCSCLQENEGRTSKRRKAGVTEIPGDGEAEEAICYSRVVSALVSYCGGSVL